MVDPVSLDLVAGCTVDFIESLGGGVLGVLAPYVAEYVLRRPDRVFILPACYVAASVVSVSTRPVT